MGISADSIAAGVSTELYGKNFKPSITRLERKPILFGAFNPALTGISANDIYTVNSPEHAGALFGFGYELHRMVLTFFKNWNGSSIDVIPVAEGSSAAAGAIIYSGTVEKSGTLRLYVSSDSVPVSVVKNDAPATVATLVAAAINADHNLPVTAAVDSEVTTKVNLTAKSKGLNGNKISVAHCLGFQEEMPSGLSAEVTAMADGAGVSNISDAVDALGTGTNQNQNYYTGGVACSGMDSDSLDILSVYNGEVGENPTGNHDGEVSRFFQFINAYTDAGSGNLTTLQGVTALRKEDNTNCCVYVPGSATHPVEIACAVLGQRELMAIDRPESTIVDVILKGVMPGSDTDDFNGNSNLNTQCVKQGISTVRKDGTYTRMQDLVSFYRPDSVSVSSNIWRSLRHQAVSQNITEACKKRFSLEKWKNITIVQDTSRVTNETAKEKAREKGDVISELISLARSFESLGWLYSSDFTISKLTKSPDDYVSVRTGGKGFNYKLPIIYSGEGGIISGEIWADANTDAAA